MPWTHPTIPPRPFGVILHTICLRCGRDGSSHYVFDPGSPGGICPDEYARGEYLNIWIRPNAVEVKESIKFKVKPCKTK